MFKIILILISLALFLALIEILARKLKLAERYINSWSWFEYDPAVGLMHKKNYKGSIRCNEFKIKYRTNSEGFRSSQEFITGSADKKVMAVLGDSIVEAIQVEENQAFVKLLESKLGLTQSQNYGMGWTGLAHFLQVYKNHISKHKPHIVVICLFSEVNFRRCSPNFNDYFYPEYSFDSQGKIIDIKSFKQRKRELSLRAIDRKMTETFTFYCFLRKLQMKKEIGAKDKFLSIASFYEDPWKQECQEAFDNGLWALKNLIGEIRKDSAIPVILWIPPRKEVNDKRWEEIEAGYKSVGGTKRLVRDRISIELEKISNQEQIVFIDTAKKLKEFHQAGKFPYFRHDIHLNSLGHEVVAEVVAEKLKHIN